MRVFDIKVLRNPFRSKRDHVLGEYKIQDYEEEAS